MAKTAATATTNASKPADTAAATPPKKKAAAHATPELKAAPALKKLPPAAKSKTTAKPIVEAGKAVKSAKAAKTESKPKPAADAKEKVKKPKLVRDSFTMPEPEYAALGEVKKACLKAGIDVKKSQLLRVGVALVRQLEIAKLKDILTGLPELKAGRPKK